MIALPSLLMAVLAASTEAPPVAASTLLSALASGDLPAARATLADDVVIMDETAGNPAASSLEAFERYVRGCEREDLTWDVDAVDPQRAAVSASWSCPSRPAAQAFIWSVGPRIVHIQFGWAPAR